VQLDALREGALVARRRVLFPQELEQLRQRLLPVVLVADPVFGVLADSVDAQDVVHSHGASLPAMGG
jgi:hypothetical protein